MKPKILIVDDEKTAKAANVRSWTFNDGTAGNVIGVYCETEPDSEVIVCDKAGNVIRNGKKTNTLWDGTIQTDDNSQKPLRLKIRNICGDETKFLL